MKRFAYSERDYAFGLRMLTLRSALGLTQPGLAAHLGVSCKAAGGWEAGEKYPNVDYLKVLMTLAMRASVFHPERKEKAIHGLL